MHDVYCLELSAEALRRIEQAGVQFSKWRGGSVLVTGKNQLQAAAIALNARVEKRGIVYNGPRLVKLVPIRQRLPRGRRRSGKAVARATPAGARGRYIQACLSRQGEIAQTTRAVANPILKKLRQSELNFVYASRRVAFADAVSPDELRQRFGTEMELLRRVNKVLDVRPTTNGVIVYTDTLVATVSDTVRREIGRFAIWIRFAGANAGVTWINRTRRVDGAKQGMNAPYVYADGQASHDDIIVSMLELIGRMELASVADLAIQYIEAVSPEHPLNAYLDRWPLAGAQGDTTVRSSAWSVRATLKRAFRAVLNLVKPERVP